MAETLFNSKTFTFGNKIFLQKANSNCYLLTFKYKSFALEKCKIYYIKHLEKCIIFVDIPLEKCKI